MAVTFLTNEDKEILDGRIETLSEEMVKRFATVAAMLSDANLTAGQLVHTGGYYADGDGGHGEYLIVNEATENPYDTLATANGKYAILQHNGHVNAKQCGLQDNATEGGDAWVTYYNGTAKSLDINVKELRVSKTVVLNKTTEIFSSIYPSVCLYWAGGSDAAVFSCFAGDGLHATAYQSTTTVKLHDISINARTAKVGFCLVNIATSNIWNLNVYKGYIGFLMGNSWRNIFGRLHGSTQTYATFYQNEFINTDIFDFRALTTNGSINASVYEMMTSVFSPNGALLMGHGSDNVFHMIEASEISDGENGIGVRFGEHSGTVNVIYCENAVPGAHYDLYADNLLSTTEGYDYNKGLMINQVRGRRFYFNNNVTIGTLFVEDWIDAEHAQDVVFEGGEQATRVTILNMPAGKYNESNLTMPYGLNGTKQAIEALKGGEEKEEKTVSVEPQTGYVKYDTGLVASDTGGWNTGYVETKGFEKAEYYGRMNSGGAVLAFYDANKLYLQSGSVAGSPSGINWVSGTVSIPYDAAYAMVSSYGTGSGNNNGGAAYLRLFSEGSGGIAGLEVDIADLTGKVNPLKGKRFAVLGDSISSVNYTLPVWWQLIAEKYGCEFVNYGVSGSRIAVTSEETGKSFTERYVAMDDTVDGVVIVGGTNDCWYTPIGTFDSADNTTLNGALNEMLPGLLNKYPGKPVLFFAPIQREDYTESDYPVTVADLKALDVTTTIGRDRVNLAIMVKCRQYGVPCVDLYSACGINGNDANSVYFRTDDNLHPSALGMQRIAGVVAAEMVKHFMFVD